MSKLTLVRLYRAEDVPDHVMQEVCDLVDKMGAALSPALVGHDYNIILSAFNRFHAGMICALVAENGLEEAAKTEAIGLVKNVEHISGITVFEGKDD